jgi:hypothetical protein
MENGVATYETPVELHGRPIVITRFQVNSKRYEVHDCRLDTWEAVRMSGTEAGPVLEKMRTSGWYSWWETVKMTELPGDVA